MINKLILVEVVVIIYFFPLNNGTGKSDAPGNRVYVCRNRRIIMDGCKVYFAYGF